MILRLTFFAALAVVLSVGGVSEIEAAEADLSWHTYQGSSAFETANAVAVDGDGNTYVAGKSLTGWGTPIEEYGFGFSAIVVAKFNSAGVLQWHTFLGDAGGSSANGIALDDSGNIYITGLSTETWGSPLHAHTSREDIVVLKLNASGVLQWHTFYGETSPTRLDYGTAVTADGNGNIYVTGASHGPWETDPVNSVDTQVASAVFVMKLDSAGALQWHTFHGSFNTDTGASIVLDASNNIYVAGQSRISWGNPVKAFSGGNSDGVVLKLNASGVLQWHTFMGSNSTDNSSAIDLDKDGQPYVTGRSSKNWPDVTPRNAHSDGDNLDYYLAKLSTSGNLQWYSFYGSTASETGTSVAIDCNGDIFIGGLGSASWGSPVNDFSGGNSDFNILKLNAEGSLLWQTFQGSTADDLANDLAVNNQGFLSVAGYGGDWGTPVDDFTGDRDLLVTAFSNATACVKIFDNSFE